VVAGVVGDVALWHPARLERADMYGCPVTVFMSPGRQRRGVLAATEDEGIS
jgi:hypothetical protein